MSDERRAELARVRADTREALRGLAAAEWIDRAAAGEDDPGEFPGAPAAWSEWLRRDPEGFRGHLGGMVEAARGRQARRQAEAEAEARESAAEAERASQRRYALAVAGALVLAAAAVALVRWRRRRHAQAEAAARARPAHLPPPSSSPPGWQIPGAPGAL